MQRTVLTVAPFKILANLAMAIVFPTNGVEEETVRN
jgi:hypothetical protein